jgi:hypothetical protein
MFKTTLSFAALLMAFPAVSGFVAHSPSRHAFVQRVSAVKPLQSTPSYEYALLFDCDGVILETEELHRLAYNAAFKEFGLTIGGEPVDWSVRIQIKR